MTKREEQLEDKRRSGFACVHVACCFSKRMHLAISILIPIQAAHFSPCQHFFKDIYLNDKFKVRAKRNMGYSLKDDVIGLSRSSKVGGLSNQF